MITLIYFFKSNLPNTAVIISEVKLEEQYIIEPNLNFHVGAIQQA